MITSIESQFTGFASNLVCKDYRDHSGKANDSGGEEAHGCLEVACKSKFRD